MKIASFVQWWISEYFFLKGKNKAVKIKILLIVALELRRRVANGHIKNSIWCVDVTQSFIVSGEEIECVKDD